MVRKVEEEEKEQFNRVAKHPLQAWEWGELRRSDRVKVIRLGEYRGNKLVVGFQVSFHKIGNLPFTIGYCPKSSIPSQDVAKKITEIARQQRAIMVKFEPNETQVEGKKQIEQLRQQHRLIAGKPLFTKFSFWLDLDKSENELLKEMRPKTRYNIRLAEKKGVKVIKDQTNEAFEEYWQLMEETTKRQSFYAHNREYHQKMWSEMKKAGMAIMLRARYQEETLAAWIIFKLNGILYYPYGASSNKHREVMASNLMMWEAIKYGKTSKCSNFDMWGALGPTPDSKDAWYGFHKFKEGYGARLVEFVGSWDLVINPIAYWCYRGGEWIRWLVLRGLK